MKKISNREREIRLSYKRFRKRIRRKKLKQRSWRIRSKALNIDKIGMRLLKKAERNQYIRIKTPRKFSIIYNHSKTIHFFDKVKSWILKYEPVYVDMSDIDYMTVDALVYYIAVLQNLKTSLKHIHIRGSFPKNAKILNLMKTSGFLKYFNTSKNNIITNNDFIEIKSGNFADNKTVKNICIFVMNKLKVNAINFRDVVRPKIYFKFS